MPKPRAQPAKHLDLFTSGETSGFEPHMTGPVLRLRGGLRERCATDRCVSAATVGVPEVLGPRAGAIGARAACARGGLRRSLGLSSKGGGGRRLPLRKDPHCVSSAASSRASSCEVVEGVTVVAPHRSRAAGLGLGGAAAGARFRTARYEMSSDYFPSNEEPWWSSRRREAPSAWRAASGPRASSGCRCRSTYDLPFCCHLLSLRLLVAQDDRARCVAVGDVGAPAAALGDDDAMWDKLLLLYDPDASGEIQLAARGVAADGPPPQPAAAHDPAHITALAEGAQSSQDVKLARVQLERSRTICRPVLEAWRAGWRRSRALKAEGAPPHAPRRLRARVVGVGRDRARARALKQYAARLSASRPPTATREMARGGAMRLLPARSCDASGRLLSGKRMGAVPPTRRPSTSLRTFDCAAQLARWVPSRLRRCAPTRAVASAAASRGSVRACGGPLSREPPTQRADRAHGGDGHVERLGDGSSSAARGARGAGDAGTDEGLNATTPALFQGSPAPPGAMIELRWPEAAQSQRQPPSPPRR